MATESETTSLHTPATATSPDEPMKTNVNEQVELKTMEQETVSLPEKGKEENPKIDELPNKTKPLSKMEGEAENKRTEPPAVEVKIDDSSTMDALVVEDKIEVKQDIPHSHAHSGPEAAGDAVESQQVAQPAIEEAQEEQPATASVEKLQDKQTTIVGVLESSTEAAQKPKELSAVLPTKESEEVAVKDPEDSEAVSKEVNKQESLVSEVHVKVQEQSEVTEQGGKQDPEDSEVVSKEVNKQESLFSEADVKVEEQSGVTEHSGKPDREDSEVMSKEVDKQESLVSEVDVIQSEVAEHSGKPDPEDSEVVSKEVNKQESLVSEVDVKAEEKSEVTEHRGKPESVEEIGKQQEPPEVLAIKESEAVVKDIEASEAAPKEIDEPQSVVPEVEVTPEEQSEVANQEEKVESIEATEKEQESSEVVLDKESEAVVVKDIEHSAVSEDEHKPESVIPAEVEMKREEQSVVLKVDEKPESLEAEADLKLKVGYEVPEKVETKSIEEKTEPVVPVVGVKPQEEIDVIGQVEPKGNIKAKTVMDEGTLADKVEDTASLKEEKTSKEEEPSTPSEQIVLAKQEAEADRKESIGESPLPDVRETIDAENGKKETDRTEVVEAPLKEATVEQENGGQETEEKTSKTEDENIERKVLNKELVQPIKVDDKGAAVSIAEVTERSSEGEKTGKVIEPVVENKKKENIKEETPALVETSKDGSIEGKLDEAITAVTEPVKESQDSGLEVKDEESAKTSEDKVGKENAEEIAKSDAHNLEPSTKNGDDAKASQDLPREVPAKPIQKQSNNILTKVKHSLVKAKKAIIGKSPSSKTLSSDTKGDIKVK